jgi:hypothetical protein
LDCRMKDQHIRDYVKFGFHCANFHETQIIKCTFVIMSFTEFIEVGRKM